MTDNPNLHRPDSTADKTARGFAVFAIVVLAIGGVMQFLQGLVAIANDDFYVVGRDYTYKFDLTAWGWIHMIIGIVAIVVAFGLTTGTTWARVLGIAIAIISAIVNFAWLPYYPVWAIIIMALDVLVIWALVRYEPTA